MIIHVTGAVKQFQKPDSIIATIEQIVQKNECSLARKDDEQVGLSSEIEAITGADIVIIEASDYTFDQGMQAAIALQQKKPTLVLSKNSLQDTALATYHNRLLSMVAYKNDADLTKEITRFIRTNTISTKDLRFNMFIDRPIYNYLRTKAYQTGKNKSEIIRDLINQEINKND